MIDLFEHQLGGGPDVDGLERHAERGGQTGRVVLGALTRGETGHRERQDVVARPPPLAVHRPGGDDQRVRRVQSAGQPPQHHLRIVQHAQALLETGHLDVVGLVAVLLQPLHIGGHERETLHLPQQADVTVGRIEAELDAAEGGLVDLVVAAVVVERAMRVRSLRSISRSTSATDRRSPFGNRSDCARHTPFSQIMVWPSHARSVVDSPSPPAAA